MTVPRTKISFIAFLFLVVSAVDSNRNLPATAIFGTSLVFFFALAALFFLFPVTLVSAELGSISPKEGGVYHWIRMAFGEKMGVLAIWLQWVNTIVWFPTILTFLAGTGAFLINPDLMYNKLYMVMMIAGIFWILTIANLYGIQLSSRLNSFCCSVGTLFPMGLLIVFGVFWVIKGDSLQISITPKTLIPPFQHFNEWTALIAVISSLTGIELAGVHISSMSNAKKMFPRAILIGATTILFLMLLGSLSIAAVLPRDDIHLAGGLMQVFAAFFHQFNLSSPIWIISFIIVLGSLGNLVNWILSPVKGLLAISEYGYLPAYFARVNKHGVASRILIAQAVFVTLLCLLFHLLPSVNAFYWFLMTLSSGIYMVMYVVMFFAIMRLRIRLNHQAFQIPGGMVGLVITCVFGLIGSLGVFAVSFIPPPGIPIASPGKYALMILIGYIVFIMPVFFLFRWRSQHRLR